MEEGKNYNNGHEWVDLGLSVKWATCNVGAQRPEEYGNYYAWGETEPKSEYYDRNCTTYEKNIGTNISGDIQYDAARKNWGYSWRMPTHTECQELVNNCTWTWETQGGVNGYRVTSKKNGKSIFLPAAGSRYGALLYGTEEYGIYWSSSLGGSNLDSTSIIDFFNNFYVVNWGYRYLGHTVRPVCD